MGSVQQAVSTTFEYYYLILIYGCLVIHPADVEHNLHYLIRQIKQEQRIRSNMTTLCELCEIYCSYLHYYVIHRVILHREMGISKVEMNLKMHF